MEFLFGMRNFFVCPSVLFYCNTFNFIVVMSLKLNKYYETSITDVSVLTYLLLFYVSNNVVRVLLLICNVLFR